MLFVILTMIVLQSDMLLLFALTSKSVISFCESDQFVAYEVLNKRKGKYLFPWVATIYSNKHYCTILNNISYYCYSYYIKNTSKTYKKQERSLHKTLLTSGHIHPNPGPFMQFSEIKKKLENYNNNLKVLHLNCRSLARKRSDLKQLIKTFNDNTIFGFSETWFNDTNDDKLWAIDNDKHKLFLMNQVKN